MSYKFIGTIDDYLKYLTPKMIKEEFEEYGFEVELSCHGEVFDLYEQSKEKYDDLLLKATHLFENQYKYDEYENLHFTSIENLKKENEVSHNKIIKYKSVKFNEKKLIRLLEIKIKRLDRHRDHLSEETVATTLNMLVLFWGRLLRNFERNVR